MIKKIFLITIVIVFVIVTIIISINSYKNNPDIISNNLKRQIAKTQKFDFKTCEDWLWSPNRTFVFDVIYANIFSPGTAIMRLTQETDIKNRSPYIIEAVIEPNMFFRRIYDARMVLLSAVRRDTKLPLWYREESFTPEEHKSKEIVFDINNSIAEREGIKYKIPKETYDPLSVFFNFLSREFKIDKAVSLKLLSKEDIYDFKITPVEVKAGIYKIKGEVFRENKSSAHGAHFKIWVFDNGKARVPLLIKVNSAGGVIYLRLKDIK